MAEQYRSGRLAQSFKILVALIAFMILGLFISIALEWIGLTWWWPDEGINHAKSMYRAELRYIGEDFRESVLVDDTAGFVRAATDWVFFHLVESWNGTAVAGKLAREGVDLLPGIIPWRDIGVYLQAAILIAQVYAMRLAIVILALPAFAVVAIAAFTDGLIRRDLRRWGGGRESAWIYGHAKKLIRFAMILPAIIYLGLPWSLHPTLVFLPFLLFTAVTVSTAAAMFKKYA